MSLFAMLASPDMSRCTFGKSLSWAMSAADGQFDVTRLMIAAADGDLTAAEQLLPLVYEQLRQDARVRMGGERHGHTLSATALVHEAYLRVVGPNKAAWAGRGHFYAAAAQAMRRILVDHARAKGARKRGGRARRIALDQSMLTLDDVPGELLDLEDALTRLEQEDPGKAQLVTLRFFGGLTMDQAAAALGLSPATADRHWAFARAWLYDALRDDS